MGRDEEGTLAKLKSFRKTLVDPAIAEHRGHIVKTTGDGMLAEFASAVDAARCAIEVQRGMAERNAGVPRELRIEFRIGIHVGDIIIDENDIFGDGVNIAARLAVLPFQNLSGDPEQEYFADGMVEDIITALSHFKPLFVIARNSSFTYKGNAVDVKQVGRELGVRYVLEGSVRKAGSRVRITGQLIEAATGGHLWADKFDGALEDVFGLQDQITTSVVGVIAPTLQQAEIERARQKPTDRLDSYDLYLRGMALANSGMAFGEKGRSLAEAREFFRKAFELDPEYGAAYAMAAWTLARQQGMGGVPLTAEMRTDAIRLANLASRFGSDDAFALARSGHLLAYLGREYDRGASMVEQAVALNPNLAVAWLCRGFVALMCCEPERAVESFDRMIRLSPLDHLRIWAWTGSSFAHFHLGRYEEGRALAMKSIQFVTDVHTLAAYIMNSIRAGHTAEAQQAVAQLLKFQPDFRASHALEVFPSRLPEESHRIISALRDAGLPE